MGIFDKLDSILSKKIRDWEIQAFLNKGLNNTFKPFITNKENSLSRLEIIDNNFPSEIVGWYETFKMQNKRKFDDVIHRYENLKSKIISHNYTVEKIINTVNSFDYNSYINCPTKEKFVTLYNYKSTLNDIDTFYIKEKKYTDFANQVNELLTNSENIINQFNLIKEYKKLNIFDSIDYVDNNKRLKILTKVNDFTNKLNFTGDKRYYDFSKIDNIDEKINDHNNKYINDNIKNPIFDSINGKSLDLNQRKAILDDEVASLVVAGAGSGKTLTICGKVKYLLSKGINPEEILLMSFSRDSMSDLESKMKPICSSIKVKTFNSLGKEIIEKHNNKKSIVHAQFKAKIEEYFREELHKRPEELQLVLNYYSLFMHSNSNDKKYLDKGTYYSDSRKYDFTTLKDQLEKYRLRKETIKKEIVKSYEELSIANFYFLNGVEYEYERPYEVDVSTPEKRQYLPDFYIKGLKIYHEHYGIDENGNCSQFEGEEAIKYLESIKWKRELHASNNTICIETYSYQFKNGTIFESIKDQLSKYGIKFNLISTEKLIDVLNSVYEGQNFKSFINLVMSFISLYKSKYTNEFEFENLKFRNNFVGFDKIRSDLFMDICKNIYIFYKNSLKNPNGADDIIDFDDMILKSINLIRNNNDYKFKYIIIDEFQDISYSRMKFLLSLVKNGNSKLFVVGDDWQSIYRFNGCDLNIFTNFKDYFEKITTNYITTTYRNSIELQNIASEFIQKNPSQIKKNMDSKKHLDKPIKILFYEDKYSSLIQCLDLISKKEKNARILILGRNNKDMDNLYSDRLFIDAKQSTKKKIIIKSLDYPGLNIRFLTVHGSKGLEEDYVIIINGDDAKLGFPNKIEDDIILNVLLSSKDVFQYSEERRLWYVALTRTRNYTYILSHKDYPSIFVDEIKNNCEIINDTTTLNVSKPLKCPICKSANLILRVSKDNHEFYGCRNYPCCTYTTSDFSATNLNHRCPKCNDFTIIRNGKYNKYYKCINKLCGNREYIQQSNYYSNK